MSQRCNPCGGTGFVNTEQLDELAPNWREVDHLALFIVICCFDTPHDIAPCSCCGTGDVDEDYPWYGVPGEHYNEDDPAGPEGPYAYNGGLCECH